MSLCHRQKNWGPGDIVQRYNVCLVLHSAQSSIIQKEARDPEILHDWIIIIQVKLDFDLRCLIAAPVWDLCDPDIKLLSQVFLFYVQNRGHNTHSTEPRVGHRLLSVLNRLSPDVSTVSLPLLPQVQLQEQHRPGARTEGWQHGAAWWEAGSVRAGCTGVLLRPPHLQGQQRAQAGSGSGSSEWPKGPGSRWLVGPSSFIFQLKKSKSRISWQSNRKITIGNTLYIVTSKVVPQSTRCGHKNSSQH